MDWSSPYQQTQSQHLTSLILSALKAITLPAPPACPVYQALPVSMANHSSAHCTTTQAPLPWSPAPYALPSVALSGSTLSDAIKAAPPTWDVCRAADARMTPSGGSPVSLNHMRCKACQLIVCLQMWIARWLCVPKPKIPIYKKNI